ncbi:hypothetical protein ACHHYP_14647 [Achlya hypogyna]|uniref:Uncharacterized protein n=1 Tax=Achlya hypogyna TaxID=1202772 RepID=A0A1V9YCR9_ACHHY|nr:hypothetical protein ACHHYP_14647 [Achlya hypogyna]
MEAKPRGRNAFVGYEQELKYAIKVDARDAVTHEAMQATCLFCMHFGREKAEGRLRKPVSTVKVYRPPFRLDNLAAHNCSHHMNRWKEYSALPSEQKRTYFPAMPPPIAAPKRKQTVAPAPREPKRAAPVVAKLAATPPVATTLADERVAMARTKHVMEIEMLRKNLELKSIEVISSTMLARQKLAEAGVARDEIDLVMTDETRVRVPGLRAEHETKYGVRVTSRDAATGEPAIVTCLFCAHFGRQIRNERARSMGNHVKVYEPPFRMDNFVQHNRLHHWDRWIAYSGMDAAAKATYFPSTHLPTDLPVAMPRKRKAPPAPAHPLAELPAPEQHRSATMKADVAAGDAISSDELLDLERKKHALETQMMKKDLELKNVQIVVSTMLARQKLLDAGVPRSEIDAMLPLPTKMVSVERV